MTYDDDADIRREELRTARYAVHSARVYLAEGRKEDAEKCLNVARAHRRLARQYTVTVKA